MDRAYKVLRNMLIDKKLRGEIQYPFTAKVEKRPALSNATKPKGVSRIVKPL